jgi:hypothetical protein
MDVPNNPPGAASVPKHIDGPHRKEQWWGFVANADYFGLPVNMLKAVGKGYSFGVAWFGSTSDTDTWLNKINLSSADVYDALVKMKYGPPRGVTSALGSAYHEGSHAYLDLKDGEPAFKKFIDDGKAHYKDAPLEDGTTSKDPERLLTEAVAEYVSDRAVAWWLAFDSLASLIAEREAGKGTQAARLKDANKARNKYNAVTKKTDYVYGYDKSSGKQSETTRPMTAAIRAFLDKEFLEDKIPDEFDKSTKLSPFYQSLVTP